MVNNHRKGGGRGAAINPVRLAKPLASDILCGKDRACAAHPGSVVFRNVIETYRAKYMKAVSKYDKMMITKGKWVWVFCCVISFVMSCFVMYLPYCLSTAILNKLLYSLLVCLNNNSTNQPSSIISLFYAEIYEQLSAENRRFLKYNDKVKMWEEITPLAGRDKIGHALRFANREILPKPNNKTSSSRSSSSRSHLKRTGSMRSSEQEEESASLDSVASSTSSISSRDEDDHSSSYQRKPAAKKSKAELAASIVEASKLEPKIWDSLVGHIQNALAPADGCSSGEEAAPSPALVQSITDPVAWENIAYAVDTGANDAALDDLISMLNDELVSEEQLQEVLGISDDHPLLVSAESPPSAAAVAAVAAPSRHNKGHSRQFSLHFDTRPNHGRMMSADDDMWSVMREPVFDWTGYEAAV